MILPSAGSTLIPLALRIGLLITNGSDNISHIKVTVYWDPPAFMRLLKSFTSPASQASACIIFLWFSIHRIGTFWMVFGLYSSWPTEYTEALSMAHE